MPAARCSECGGVSVLKNGTAVIQHDRDCEIGNDYQPKLSETLSMRDIVVPSSLDELYAVTENIIRAFAEKGGEKPRYPEVHFVLKYEENGHHDASFIEVRGRVRRLYDPGEDSSFRIMAAWVDEDTMQAFAYKSVDGEPDPISAIDISRFVRGDKQGAFRVTFAHFQMVSVSLIHEPSPLIPVVQ